MHRLVDEIHAAIVLPPVADALAGTIHTTPIRLGPYAFAHFLLAAGVGNTGTSQITVEACDDAAGNNPVAIPFTHNYQAAGANSNDTWQGYVQDAAVGFLTPAGSHRLFAISVDARYLPEGKPFVRLTGVEQTASAVAAAVIALLSNARFMQHPPTGVFS